MLKFLKIEAVGRKEGLPLSNVNYDDGTIWVPLKKVDVGSGAGKLLRFPDHKDFFHSSGNVYIQTCKYLQMKLPLTNPLLSDLKYINPSYQKERSSKEGISRLADHMLKVIQTGKTSGNIKNEYASYMCEDFLNDKPAFRKIQTFVNIEMRSPKGKIHWEI